jgi:hypothetical protein
MNNSNYLINLGFSETILFGINLVAKKEVKKEIEFPDQTPPSNVFAMSI